MQTTLVALACISVSVAYCVRVYVRVQRARHIARNIIDIVNRMHH
jgi:hypothetical protein